MNTTMIGVAAGASSLFISFFTTVGINDALKKYVYATDSYSLEFVSLEYDGNNFIQNVQPRGATVVRGKWAAKITRDGEWLCGGGGIAPYEGKVLKMTPTVWAGSDCPELMSGDIAKASWTYEDVNNRNVTISTELIIK